MRRKIIYNVRFKLCSLPLPFELPTCEISIGLLKLQLTLFLAPLILLAFLLAVLQRLEVLLFSVKFHIVLIKAPVSLVRMTPFSIGA
jgi:hypothetical protein